jgi:hypothetical protein
LLSFAPYEPAILGESSSGLHSNPREADRDIVARRGEQRAQAQRIFLTTSDAFALERCAQIFISGPGAKTGLRCQCQRVMPVPLLVKHPPSVNDPTKVTSAEKEVGIRRYAGGPVESPEQIEHPSLDQR